ncbi:hypothetical protein HYX16_00750 [Candidatus Woesearchaeota archaeon]|nr:hypothetical protein [Candidatus Woesearchaeota archaeon]
MHEIEVLEKLSKLPVFSLSDLNQIIENRGYAKKFLKRMCSQKKILKIKKNFYTFYKDDFLVSTFLVKPSYISSASALSYFRLITQIPNEVFCITQKKPQKIGKINFFHTNYFFGFKNEEYENFKIMIAEPEKAIIDSFSIIPVSIFEEAFEEINADKMIKYLKKIRKSSIIKRVGYIMEKNGFDVYNKLKNLINYKYINLDPLLKSKGRKDIKWKIIDNVK